MKYLTIVYSLPAGFDVGTLTQHEFACAFAWSHKMDECNDLKAALRKANASTERFEREWYLRGDALEDLERFSEMIAAQEREACAKVCEQLSHIGSENQLWMRDRCVSAIRQRSNAIAHRPVEAEGRNGSGGATVCAAKGSE